MSRIAWHQVGEKKYKTGVDRGVLYVRDDDGKYPKGVPWNGLRNISENPSGGEPNAFWADNTKYLNLMSVEEYEGSIGAYYAPKEFDECDGTAAVAPGVTVGQQDRATFGLCFRTLIGNDVDGTSHGYKLTLVWGASASPSDKEHETINDTPSPDELDWDFTTIPIDMYPMVDKKGRALKPIASMVIDSTDPEMTPEIMRAIEDIFYGTDGDPTATPEPIPPTVARLPLPKEMIELINGLG